MENNMTPREYLVQAIVKSLLEMHNDGYVQGTELVYFRLPPIWMTRKAEKIANDLDDSGG